MKVPNNSAMKMDNTRRLECDMLALADAEFERLLLLDEQQQQQL